MKLALAQINTKLGERQANLEKHIQYIGQAQQQGADLIVFPELALTGYILQDLAVEVAIRPDRDSPYFKALLDASQQIDIITGFAEAGELSQPYISAAYLSGGEVVHIHRKVYLPTYGLFDEGRFFAAGDQVRAFDTRFGRLGVLICEDYWHVSPPYLLWLDGAELMVFISASPSHGLTANPELESSRWVRHISQAYAQLFTCFVAATNRVGFEDGINFWGGAAAYSPDGELLAQAPQQEEALVYADVDLSKVKKGRSRLPLLRDERPQVIQKELARLIYTDKETKSP